MRTTTRIALLVTAVLVLLGMTAPAASAHSGRSHGDRHRHEFAGHTQGRSTSDPDGMRNGGPDKPGFRGGFSADRDGNNGCGNDDDREDDNNGNCGGKRARAGDDDDEKARVAGKTEDRTDDDHDKARVAGDTEDRRKVVCEAILSVLGRTESKDTLVVSGTTDSQVVKTHIMSVVFKPAVLAAIQAVINTVIQAPAAQPATPTFQPAAVEAVVKAAVQSEAQPAAAPAETAVLGAQVERQPSPALAPQTQVAGAQENRFGALATTGLALGGLALLGAALVTIGRLARGAGRA
jgi:hypothetical protein